MKKKEWKNASRYIIPLMMAIAMVPGNANAVPSDANASVMQQTKKITGVVKDANGEAIIGASVIVKGSTQGVATDIDGRFELPASQGAVLEVSYVGYQTKQIKVGNLSFVEVTLEEDLNSIDEVVVVGYGVQKKVNLTGAVDAVKGDDISKKATLKPSQALQGMIPGVTITTNSGRPGSEGTSVRIRGIGTLNSNDPLVLIDGVSGSLDAIDPNDIENMSVLKDAASAAIYGSRAANGVILITTKRGKNEKVNVTYRATLGISNPTTRIKNADAWDYMALYDEANANDLRDDNGNPGGYIYGPELINTWKNATDRDAYPNSDIWNETYKSGATQTTHYLGLSGGTDRFQSNTSLNYSWQDALIDNEDYSRYGIRSNNNYKVNEYVAFGADLSLRKVNMKQYTWISGVSGLDGLMRQPAIFPTRYSNGTWGYTYAGTPHPMMQIAEELAMAYNEYTEAITKFNVVITPFKGLRLDASYAPKINYHEYKQLYKDTYLYDYKTGDVTYSPTHLPTINEQRFKDREDDVNILLNYNVTLGKHDIAAMCGFQYLKHKYNELRAFRDGNEFTQYEEMNSFDPTNQTNSGTTTEWALMSYFGRLNYAFDNRYLLEANIRYDGSSRFSKGNKWGVFPSFSAGWRFQQESFMKNVSWLSNGKLRASWGELGNQEGLGSNYPFSLNIATNQYSIFNNGLQPGYAAVNYALNNITWESTRMIDFGIDLGFWNNRLTLTFDWYKKNTKDILLTMAIPGVMGYNNSPKQNAGAVENKGWDLTLSWNDRIGDLSYRITGVLSDVHNEITDLGGLGPQVSGIHVNMVGEPINAIYGYQADGYFSSFQEARSHSVTQWGKLQGGDLKYIDTNGDGKMTGDDRKVIGNVIPRWCFSLDLFAEYKGLELSAFFQGVGKRDAYMAGWEAYPLNNASTILEQHKDRWYEGNPNPNARYPRLTINQRTNNTQTSTHWLENGAYLRLKNIQLAYSLPKSWVKAAKLTNVKVFANASNLFTISSLPLGIDPESPEAMQNGYPLLRTYTFGLEVKF